MRISLRADEILADLTAKERLYGRRDGFGEACAWHPEYGAWMVEGTPRFPYSGFTADLRRVETNMILRRTRLAASLRPGEAVLSIPAFPTLGTSDFCAPAVPPGGEIASSTSLPDAVINRNPRFHTLTRNIRLRRGSTVDARIPLYKDARTPAAALTSGIRMDAMGYGMGCCCLQVTFQARDVDESRHLYDHLAVLSPIFLALTAATPVLRGKLADTDVRWDTIAAAVDDRTPQERGAPPLPEGTPPLHTPAELAPLAGGGVASLAKSRYESISLYLANCAGCQQKYCDLDAPVDAVSVYMLTEAG